MQQKSHHSKSINLLREALALLEKNYAKEAMDLLDKGGDFGENNLLKDQIYAASLSHLKEYNRAECAYLAMIREYPDSLDSQFALSELYLTTGRFTQSEELLDAIITVNPEYYMAWNNKGNLAKLRKDYEGAFKCYEKSLSFSPNFLTALKNMCSLYQIMGEDSKAAQVAKRCLANHPQCLWAYETLIKYYKNNQDEKSALLVLNQAFEHCGERETLRNLQAS